jgi:diguanylate cyclase (GGDEF)-like protein/putative nucleotidyltransferase with HDIG domain
MAMPMPHSGSTRDPHPTSPSTTAKSASQAINQGRRQTVVPPGLGLQAAMARFGQWLNQGTGHRFRHDEAEAKRQAHAALKKLTTLQGDTPQHDMKHLIQTASELKDVWRFLLRKLPEHFGEEAPLLWLGFWTVHQDSILATDGQRQDLQLRFCSPRRHDFDRHPITVASDFRSNHFLQAWQKQDTQFSNNPWQLGLQDILPDFEVYTQEGSTPPRLNVFSVPLVAGGQTVAMVSMGVSTIDANTQSALGYLYEVRNHLAQLSWNLLLQDQMAQQAQRDPLTGLLSFSHFQAQMAKLIQKAQVAESQPNPTAEPLTLLVLDINRLHQVNKTFGYSVGDALLQNLSQQLLQAASEAATAPSPGTARSMAARFGSDELVFLATDMADAKLQTLVNHLIDCVDQHPLAKQHGLTISIGSASLPNAAYPSTALLAVAETALAVAKQQSKATHTSIHLDSRQLLQTSPQKVLDAWAARAVDQVAIQVETAPEGQAAFSADGLGSLEALVRYVEARDEGHSTAMETMANPLISPNSGLGTSTPMMLETIHSLSGAMNAKDQYTDGHAYAVARYAVKLAQAVGFDAPQTETVRLAALLHDIGKIGIPESILCKPGPLTDEEWEVMKQHPVIGARKILAPISGLRDVIPMVEHHHEHWDGSGHPLGLKGEAIPIGARIVAIVDAFHALTSNRCYRKALSLAQTKQILSDGAGRLWDPYLTDVFLTLLDQTLGTTEAPLESMPMVHAIETPVPAGTKASAEGSALKAEAFLGQIL